MKKLVLLLALVAAPAFGQVWVPVTDAWIRVDGGLASGGGGGAITGGTCTNQFVRALDTAGVPTCASVAIGADVSGLGSGVAAWLATASSANLITAVTDETGTGSLVFATSPTLVTPALGTPSALVLTNATGLPVGSITGLGSNVATWLATASSANLRAALSDEVGTGPALFPTAPTAAGQHVTYDGTNYAFTTYPVNPAAEFIVWDDFLNRPGTGGGSTAVNAGSIFGVGSGTASGFITATVNSDSNHPGIYDISTGSTTTGTYSINSGLQVGGGSAIDNINITGGEITEWMIYIPVASNDAANGNIFNTWVGLCDVTGSNGDCTDGLYFYWDNNTDTHWGCAAAGGATRTKNLSTTVATAAAWHKMRIEVNAAATSVAYKVDGATLSCSPVTGGNIPSGNTEGTGLQFRLGASAGCTAATGANSCTGMADYVYFYKPLAR